MEDFKDNIKNFTIIDAFTKADSVIKKYSRIAVSVSGGKDSDIVVDLISSLDKDKKCRYVWFDTGIEYRATIKHLEYLENHYGITIERYRAIKPIPKTCKEDGQPFLNKFVSEMIDTLQCHNFKWEDKSYDELIKEYPTIKGAISWWTNHRECGKFKNSMFNISYNKHLKEFIIQNPPEFRISKKCCTYAKKKVSLKYIKDNNIECMVTGLRKSEGGIRSVKIKTCFDIGKDVASYRPVFWLSNEDEMEYIKIFDIKNSDCYTKYGMKRTGCAGCPYNRNIEKDLKVIEEHEPLLYIACNTIFKESYAYTRKYKEFCEKMKCS